MIIRVPPGLKKQHTTMKNVWGKIVVLDGQLTYVIEVSNNNP